MPDCGAGGLVDLSTSWSGNFAGKLRIPITEDIFNYTINLETNLPLTNIQVPITYLFNFNL